MLSERRCAVTVISWIPSESVAAVESAACAIPMLKPEPLKIAAMAYDNFEFEFIACIPYLLKPSNLYPED